MKKLKLFHFGFRGWSLLLALLLSAAVFSSYFIDVSAQTKTIEKAPEQNLLVNGRLAFSSRESGPTPPVGSIIMSNPDGSGRTALPATLTQFASEPAWSPDGLKLAFASNQQPSDIYVANEDGSGQINLTNTGSSTELNPSWSITGKIAYWRDLHVWTMNSDGSEQAQFTAITQPFPSAPAWSADGTKLAFSSDGEIWVINSDGTNERRVTNNATSDTDPAWSPDGLKIVFTKGTATIAVINADGTNEQTIATSASSPSWSPDGTKIAFRRDGINTMDPDGSNQVRIVANIIRFPLCCDTAYEHPAWQPVAQTPNTFNITGRVTHNNLPVSGATVNLSGTTKAAATTDAIGNYQFSALTPGGNYTVSPSFPKHYFTPVNRSVNNLSSNQTGQNFDVLAVCQGGNCARNGKIALSRNGDIFTINGDGTGSTNITNNAAANDGPNYSPDGSKIVFFTSRDGNEEIYRMDADGSNPVRLTKNTASDTMPFYSPDGMSIVFQSLRDGNSEIYEMNADGTNQERLTNNTATDSQPAFSPDGSRILFISGPPQNLWTMGADGSNPQPISPPTGISPSYNRPSYSPDGLKIIFSFTPDAVGAPPLLWTMNVDGSNRTELPGGGGMWPTYSPDGRTVVYICCTSDSTQRPWKRNADGTSATILAPSLLQSRFPDWQGFRVARAAFDFDGDGRTDVSVFRPSEGAWYLLRSTAGLWVPLWGLSTDVPVPADYDGDLKTDVAVWRPSEGNFYVLNSFDSTVRIENFGLAGDVPTGGDWDGDGKADVAVWRGGPQGVFYFRASMGNPQANITSLPWGTAGDKPVAGDYDGDGITDAAIYRGGVWWIRNSSNGQSLAYNFGLPNDTLVPDDYDGDGRTDQAVYRDGIWYLLRSTQGFTAFQYGIVTDVPVPGDYDGDGRADAAIYRGGEWWIQRSQTGATEVYSWGLGTDKPIPSAFVR